jgi:succinate-semialdehyde dehydrogenase / glutarate-semialdehyde dehydrogenase
VRHARRIASNIKAGTVNINECYASAYASQDAPMGGMKQSGLGRRHGAGGLLKYVDQQNVAAQHFMGFDPALGLSPKQHVAFFGLAMKLIKGARTR